MQMKRFYKMVTSAPAQGGHGIFLDGKPVMTPGRLKLVAETKNLAEAIAAEWAAQTEKINPHDMPLTQILNTQLDRIPTEREAMTTALLKYIDTDLLCYRAGGPTELKAMQDKAWNPPLTWLETHLGITLQTTTGIRALAQPQRSHQMIEAYIEGLSTPRFTVFQLATAATGSLVLAAALTEGAMDASAIFAAARVEETHKATIYNEERYGPDPAQSKKDAALKTDLTAAEMFLKLTATP